MASPQVYTLVLSPRMATHDPMETFRRKREEHTLILFVLNEFRRFGTDPVDENDLQHVIRHAQMASPARFRFIDTPVPYSFDLHSYLLSLWCVGDLDQIVRPTIASGGLSTYAYSLGEVARLRTEEYGDEYANSHPALVEAVRRGIQIQGDRCRSD